MKWKCKSCKQLQKSCLLGFFFNNKFNCDKCIRYVEILQEKTGEDFIARRDALVSGAEE